MPLLRSLLWAVISVLSQLGRESWGVTLGVWFLSWHFCAVIFEMSRLGIHDWVVTSKLSHLICHFCVVTTGETNMGGSLLKWRLGNQPFGSVYIIPSTSFSLLLDFRPEKAENWNGQKSSFGGQKGCFPNLKPFSPIPKGRKLDFSIFGRLGKQPFG